MSSPISVPISVLTHSAQHLANFPLQNSPGQQHMYDSDLYSFALSPPHQHRNGFANGQYQSQNSQQFMLEQSLSKTCSRVSAFLPVEEISAHEKDISENETVSLIYTELYTQYEDVESLVRVLAFHPEFMSAFHRLNTYLMYNQGALPFQSRHYIAIMAASRHKCLYLVNQQEREFKLVNGEAKWLNGLDFIPQKLKDLYELNKLLCHRPWLINQSHIEKILNAQNSWHITELLMAVAILTNFHALSGLSYGCGINEAFMQQNQKDEVERTQAAEKAALDLAAKLKSEQNAEEDEDEDELGRYSEDDLEDDYELESDDFSGRDSVKSSEHSRKPNRSHSSGNANRTLSNSSASSCELSIDVIVKEMQTIQADDSTKLLQQGSAMNNAIPISRSSGPNKHSSSSLSRSLLHSNSSSLNTPTTAAALSNCCISDSSTLSNSSPSSLQSTAAQGSTANGGSYLTDLSNSTKARADQGANSGFQPAKPASHHFNDSNNLENNDSEGSIDEKNNNSHVFNNKNVNRHRGLSQNEDENSKGRRSESSSRPHRQSLSNSHNVQDAAAAESQKANVKSRQYVNKYLLDADYGHVKFNEEADEHLGLEYYTWEKDGLSAGYSLYQEIFDLLDQTFTISANMTYHTMGSHRQVDTSLFRRAVWLYIHSIFGVRYDDYDYNQIKQLLASPLRNYIKILCTAPEKITKKDYDSIMKEFTHSEKIHVNIVIMEARIQASMLYFLRAISMYYQSIN